MSTGGGNIELGDISGPVEIETGGGSIRLGWAKGVVRAETGAGRIELNGVSSARAETGAGGILAKFISSNGERTDSVLQTSAGDIVAYIAADVAMTIRASIDLANGHKISSDFTDIRVTSEGGDWPGPKSFTAEGKPTSITFLGRLYNEAQILALARLYQEKAGFTARRPLLKT